MEKLIFLDDAIEALQGREAIISSAYDAVAAIKTVPTIKTIEVSEDCISREWLKGQIEEVEYKNMWHMTETDKFVSWENIENAPRAVPSRAEGEWLHKEVTSNYQVTGQCSICKERKRIDNYCPNCGAKMKGASDESLV